MKLIRIILFPVVPIYYVVTLLRNWLYDQGLKSSKSYDFPVICVGNLSTGGTGKTPMIEYLIRFLKDEKNIATLSRGYKRSTTSFVLADETADATTIGDEPFQFYRKFDKIKVAVDRDRQNGIEQLLNLSSKTDVILLDDAFQHRKVKAGLNILLTSYDNLFYKDIVLPTGNLREPRNGYKRAQLIVVTKCPATLSDSEKKRIINGVKPVSGQQVFFSNIIYSEYIYSEDKTINLKDLGQFTLVTGIAKTSPLIEHLESLNLKFDHLEYPDHHNFSKKEIDLIKKKELILTTEKDYVRLSNETELKGKLFYLPIELNIEDGKQFNSQVRAFVN
ncbi:tetraacyldisaccharide 4'-kinase [Winogradskyella ursingii]|uniref:tetraacyldisaccharide 4'-kinase n=1 Tax=Winogradskyella ursingii TaxID=2686079 RepID=UPI0015C79080|nr:tetraacyldisaccharide 4'-kinase [Winogradskyella ursingii]